MGVAKRTDIEARVHEQLRLIDNIKHIAGVVRVIVRIGEHGVLLVRRRELEVLVHVRRVVAVVAQVVHVGDEAVVEVHQVVPVVDVARDHDLLLQRAVGDDWVVDRDALERHVRVELDEGVGDVGAVVGICLSVFAS